MERYLAQLAAEMDDTEAIRPVASDAWAIALDGDIELQLRAPEGGQAQIMCDFCDCPAEVDTLERLLLANFSGRGTLGSVLGLDAEQKRVTLKFALPSDGTYRDLREAVEDFYNCALFWKREIPNLSAPKEIQTLAQRKAAAQ